jgi:2-phospho-L-lactate guanylyltransferase
LVPYRGGSESKTRLSLPPDDRRVLSRAFLFDTLLACSASALVREVHVVGEDSCLPRAVELNNKVHLWPVRVRDGLNSDLASAADSLGRTGPIAVLLADLPSLSPESLTEALSRAAQHSLATVSDRHEIGTTMLFARHKAAFKPSFGAGSHKRHVLQGAVTLADVSPRLKLDVDTQQDLAMAAGLGVGPYTRDALSRMSKLRSAELSGSCN